MGQLYKTVALFLLNLFRTLGKRKKVKDHPVLNFNTAKLGEQLEKASLELHRTRREDSFRAMKFAIEVARNIQILEINRLRSHDALLHHQGRLEAFTDLLSFIDNSTDEDVFREKKKRLEGDRPKEKILRSRAPTSESVI